MAGNGNDNIARHRVRGKIIRKMPRQLKSHRAHVMKLEVVERLLDKAASDVEKRRSDAVHGHGHRFAPDAPAIIAGARADDAVGRR